MSLRCTQFVLIAACTISFFALPCRAVILWSDLGSTLVHETGAGTDILGGAVKRDDKSSDTLYFKFHVDPLSDVRTEEYFAAFQLFENNEGRLAVGNTLEAWAYSAFNTSMRGDRNKVFGDINLRTLRPAESGNAGEFLPYEFPRRGIESTIVFKVKYVPNADDEVTIWLNPNLGPGATEESQPEGLTTTSLANASFNEIRVRHGGGGDGWTFSDMAIATSFNDFVGGSSPDPFAGGRGSFPHTFRTWQREQGLPENSVRALARTPEGYLWVGTDDGLARFDGVRFLSFGMREGLRSARIRVLLADSSGVLWIGTEGGGLSRLENGRFITLTLPDGLPSDSITSLAEDTQKQIWIGTESGLVVWRDKNLTNLKTSGAFKGKAISCLMRDHNGVMWMGATGVGLFRFVGDDFVSVTEPSAEGLLLDPHCLLEDQGGRIWLGVGDDLLLCREGEEWRRYRISRHLARPYISVLAEEPEGTVWAGSVSEGLFQFKGGKLAPVSASSGLSDNSVDSLLTDREGNLWVGTRAGLNRLRRSNLRVFGQNEGLRYGPIQGLAEVSPGMIIACKPNDGIYRSENHLFNPLTTTDASRQYSDANTVLLAHDGSCWVGAVNGLFHFLNPASESVDDEGPFVVGRNVISLAEDSGGMLYAGTREGEIWRKTQGAWLEQTNLAQQHPVTAIAKDKSGNLWLGTAGGGLTCYGNGSKQHYDSQNGLLSDLVRGLYLGHDGIVWIGTSGGGLSRLKDGHIVSFTSREGLPDNTISQILEDDYQRLWLGNNRGIACVRMQDLEAVANGKTLAVYPQVYGRAEGMPSEECTGGFSPAGLRTHSGLLWFPTLKGIVVADASPQNAEAPPPPVILEELLVDGVTARRNAPGPVVEMPGTVANSVSSGSKSAPKATFTTSKGDNSGDEVLVIPPGKRRLEFHYTGLSLRSPERIRFRYQLEGLDPDWVEAGTERTAVYGYVPPGGYQFRVKACNIDGVWGETSVSMKLTALPYFWQAKWFIAIVAMALLLGVGGVTRIVETRKHKKRLLRLEQERTLERERARIAQDLHDDLGSSLTRMSLLSDLLRGDKANPAQVEIHASKINQSAAQTVRALEEIVWALRPGSDTLQSLVDYIAHFANELFEEDHARCRLDLPHDLPNRALPPEMRHNIFLIVKEALTNSLKHAHASEVRVQAKVSGNLLEIVVQDNGRGFDSQATHNSAKGHGLGNMRRRAEAMAGSLSIDSQLKQGTTTKLKVQLPALVEQGL